MTVEEKLEILTDAAKYDAACTSSGISRSAKKMGIGNATCAGICHSFSADGRCVSLLKILLSNECVYDCSYCVNRISNDTKRASFTAKEVADLTINFYKRNYIEGLFLSSAVIKNPDYTMELMCSAIEILRFKYFFNGYIHAKVIPGSNPLLVERLGFLVDRLSVNIELPSEQSLKRLAPQKSKNAILKPMGQIKNAIAQSGAEVTKYRHAQKFAPAGQSTQMIIGASNETDYQILRLTSGMYKNFSLKRVFFSAYVPVVTGNPLLPINTPPPLLREHRLYQADWLMRFYGFEAEEILSEKEPNFDPLLDPKCSWALRNINLFPVEINKADFSTLIRIPGIGRQSAFKICRARTVRKIHYEDLKRMGIVLKRAKYFILCDGKYAEGLVFNDSFIKSNLIADKSLMPRLPQASFTQLPLFPYGGEKNNESYLPV